MKYIATVNEQEIEIEVGQDREITVNGERYDIDFHQLPDGGLVSLLLNNLSYEAVVEAREDVWDVLLRGELYSVTVQDERAYRLAKARGADTTVHGEAVIKSPMPGIIIAAPAAEGSYVHKGDKIIILESMKMENELRSPRDGIVTRVQVKPGDGVEKGQVLAVISDGAAKD
ncbi:MAG: biotin attachment protein [Ardenticatenaceae bacterium]|nr:biotin attachment protein [Ardenticatenaceae bacterium]MCB9443133.1 biotin attachment protein [Ardenticatenaceae bacterium]